MAEIQPDGSRSMKFSTTLEAHPETMEVSMLTRLTAEKQLFDKYASQSISEMVASQLADEFVKVHGNEILAKLDLQVLANLVTAKVVAALSKRYESGDI